MTDALLAYALLCREELVEYLLARAPGARAEWLPFQGANRVVFSPRPTHAPEETAPLAAGAPT